MDPGRVSRGQELSRLVLGLGLRVRRKEGKGREKGNFQGKGEKKLQREERKEAS